ncbi:MAG: SIS domain-containing protein [Mesorhizobium sp.]|uniref:SIS domain-containing protein n=2 Tax=Mesorhizobium sp. TaxID=1871066 RepID=UPI000FE58E63|nr:MAG: SIS domain-containing protein [Mesorhizobium sp.]TIP47221.1 MAG: SIS domain-containing protein [Mesorhizobium sp.]TJW99248.1 MAG: SIS domain-containing protein [Mesorhizobium sp.]
MPAKTCSELRSTRLEACWRGRTRAVSIPPAPCWLARTRSSSMAAAARRCRSRVSPCVSTISPVSVVGDMTAPPLGAGDVFLVSSGPGETSTVLTLMQVAREAGATVLLLTAQGESSAARLADFTLLIPAQTMADDQGPEKTSVLPMGSVFEGALFVLFEVMVLKLKTITGMSSEAMRARHTNME